MFLSDNKSEYLCLELGRLSTKMGNFAAAMQEFLAHYWLDMVTTALGLAYILLELRASRWMWAVGAVMQVLGIVLYYQKGLYADCGMEFYYLAMTAYGFAVWTWGGRKKREPRAITHFPLRPAVAWTALTAILWAAIYYVLTRFTDSTVPLADSFTTALSVMGIWALAHKYLEQWFIWIAVDVVTCVLYFYKDIPFKGSLYGLYVIIAVAGYFAWRKRLAPAPHPVDRKLK